MTSSSTRPMSADVVKLPSRVRLVARADGVTLALHEFSNGRLTVGSAQGNDVVIDHPTVSRRHLELSIERDALFVKDLESRNGTRLGGSRIREAFVSVGNVVLVGAVELRLEDGDQREAVKFGGLEAVSASMRSTIEILAGLARGSTPVLLEGEPGTGQDTAARALHLNGPRAERPFEVVDCRALTAATGAALLFGHRDRAGALSRAARGTLFLDGPEALPLELQQQLLGALKEGRGRRSGDGEPFVIEARIVSGTANDLGVELNAGRLRADLLAYLATERVRLPALRERLEDLPLLVRHILERLGPRARGFVLSAETFAQLEAHPWPGNVQELQDFIEKALALGAVGSQAATLDDDVPGQPAPPAPATLDYKQAREEALTSFEREYVTHLLRTFDGNVSKASREAGLDRGYLHRLIKRHDLDEK